MNIHEEIIQRLWNLDDFEDLTYKELKEKFSIMIGNIVVTDRYISTQKKIVEEVKNNVKRDIKNNIVKSIDGMLEV